jgi:hypothetical protein
MKEPILFVFHHPGWPKQENAREAFVAVVRSFARNFAVHFHQSKLTLNFLIEQI